MTWRVVVTGSECTGKTTLAHALAQHLGVPVADEASRAYAEARGGMLGASDVEPIAQATLALHDALAGAPIAVFDTDLVSTVVYARAYYGECPTWIEDEAQARLGQLYLLCVPDIPWEADGVRDRPAKHERELMHDAFAETLRAFGARVVNVDGTGEARVQGALVAVRAAHPNRLMAP